jgi:hypothetical protein
MQPSCILLIMNVNELRTALDSFPDDLEILVASDEEGNDFKDLACIQESFIHRDGFEVNVLHPDDAAEYEEDELETALVIWP